MFRPVISNISSPNTHREHRVVMFPKRANIVFLLINLIFEVSASNILGLFTSPHRSHMLVYNGVVRGLLKKGHNITIVTVLPAADEQILQKNLTIIQLSKPPKAKSAYGIFRQISVIAAGGKTFDDPRFQQFLMNTNTRFDLVILGYLFNDYQLGVAAHFECPTIVIWTTQLISFVKRFIGEPNQWTYVAQPFVRSQEVGIRGVVYGAFETVFRWVLDFLMDDIYRKYFPSPFYPNLADLQNNVSLVLCNHHFSEGPIEAHLPNLIEISGIQINNSLDLPKVLEEFMDSAECGVIYFSLGTVVSARDLDPSILNTFLAVFSSIPQKVLWKIDTLETNSSNILISKWFPQSNILAHSKTKLFITHGGKGSTIEALNYAVPMISIPIFGDQFGNARRFVKKGFGLQLNVKNITESSFRKSIFDVLNNATFYRNIKAASRIYKDRPLNAEKTAVYWIEYVIRHKGALHMQSPTKKINFIQFYNIDVYFLCFSFVYTVDLFLRLAIGRTYRWLRRIQQFVLEKYLPTPAAGLGVGE